MKKVLIGTPNIVKCAKFPNENAPNSQMGQQKFGFSSLFIFIVTGRSHGMGSDLFARYHLYSTIDHIYLM